MNSRLPGLCLAPFLLAAALAGRPSRAAVVADVIYHHGDLVTVNDRQPAAQALAVRDGRIAAVGSDAEVLALKGDSTRVIDLQGKTVLPGFLDGHGHFINSLSISGQANVYAPPFGPGDTIEGIVGALKKLQQDRRIPPGELIMAYGYDDSLFPEGGKLTAAHLDAALPANPVMVGHVSLHGAVFNTAALRKYNITAATPTPPGGVIVRKPGSQEPEGLLMETAFLPIFAQLPKPSPEDQMQRLVEGQRLFAAAGVTTAHEGATHLADLEILRRGATSGKLFIDVIAFPFITELEQVLQAHPASTFGKYDGRLKLGGVKITIDGSPQGRTAHFTTPYLTGGPDGQKDWKGEPTFPYPVFEKMVRRVHELGLPMIVHANGDAAIDSLLRAHETVLGDARAGDHRTGIIHCQFVRRDQLEKIAAWKLIPSFYTEHTFFFGTTHTRNRGREQAAFLSPAKTALSMGIRFSNHTDFNVSPIDQLFVIWTAVNRLSREGEVIGPDERISPLQAIKAITLDTAYWYREEDRKGSLEPGKLADLVILDRNPLKVEPMAIKDIKVLETIKEGRTVFPSGG